MSETIRNSFKEKTSPPPYHVSKMDEQWAFGYGVGMRRVLDEWTKVKGYTYNCPDIFKPYFEGNMSEEQFKATLHDWYATWDPTPQVKQLEEAEVVFNRGISRYLPQQSWGFDIPDTYNVVVTPFAIGAGGAGQRLGEHGPVITMWYGREWGKGRRTPEETLLHEAYHLGADGVIQQVLGSVIMDKKEYQQVKERTVDTCSTQLLVPDVLPKTHLQYETPHPVMPFLEQQGLPVRQRLQNFAASLGR